MTILEMKTFIGELINELTSIQVVWAYQNSPVPSKKFIRLTLGGERSIGDEVRPYDDTTVEDYKDMVIITGLKEATLSIDGYGAEIIETLNNLWQNLQRPTIVDKCFAAGISFNFIAPVQDLTSLLDSRAYQERGLLDVTLCYGKTVIDKPMHITSVEVNGELLHSADKKKTEQENNAVTTDVKIKNEEE